MKMTKQIQLRWMFDSEKYDFISELQKAVKREFSGQADMNTELLCTQDDVFLYAKQHQLAKKLLGTYSPTRFDDTRDGDYLLAENGKFVLYTQERGNRFPFKSFESETAADEWLLTQNNHSDEALLEHIKRQFNWYIKK